MIPHRRRLLLALGAVALWAATAPAASAPDSAAADALMRDLMAKYAVPGAALALIKDDRIVLAKGYGLRDLETHAPVTTTTLFNIGSISKSFTALAIAQLAERQRVDLDAPVMRYLPDLRLSDPGAATRLTLRQLLSHSSGFPADEAWARLVPATRAGIVREFATMPITAAAGARFQYCSRCIVLAAAVLEHVTGQSWEAYTRQEIFRPLGMTTASFGPRGLEASSDRAQPYRQDAAWGEDPVAWRRLDYLEPLAPAGGINADIDDMARYALLQLDEGVAAGERVLSAAMMSELHRPEIATGADWRTAAQFQDVHYALGWFTGDWHGRRLVFHNGVNPGFRAAIVLIPAEKAGAVILTNAESTGFIEAARAVILEELLP